MRLLPALVFSLFAAATARAEAPVALVLDITGPGADSVEAFSELYPGDAVDLGAGSIEFMHYPGCEEVVVEGGRLSFSAQNYTARQGKVADVRSARCPKEVALGSDTQVGGVVLRAAGGKALKIAPRPTLLLVGKRAGTVSGLRLLKGEVEQGRFEGQPGPNAWPDGARDLKVKGRYVLEITFADGASETVPLVVEKARKREALRLIRLD